jgi:hypothetical protein
VGQNKNNIVLHLVPLLVECGYFKEVQFCFLIIGHTKNVCDWIFNSLKYKSHKINIWTFLKLLSVIDDSYQVTILEALPSDFLDVSKYEGTYYRDLAGLILQNHIFSVKEEDVILCPRGKKMPKIQMHIRDADFSESTDITHQSANRAVPKPALCLTFPCL